VRSGATTETSCAIGVGGTAAGAGAVATGAVGAVGVVASGVVTGAVAVVGVAELAADGLEETGAGAGRAGACVEPPLELSGVFAVAVTGWVAPLTAFAWSVVVAGVGAVVPVARVVGAVGVPVLDAFAVLGASSSPSASADVGLTAAPSTTGGGAAAGGVGSELAAVAGVLADVVVGVVAVVGSVGSVTTAAIALGSTGVVAAGAVAGAVAVVAVGVVAVAAVTSSVVGSINAAGTSSSAAAAAVVASSLADVVEPVGSFVAGVAPRGAGVAEETGALAAGWPAPLAGAGPPVLVPVPAPGVVSPGCCDTMPVSTATNAAPDPSSSPFDARDAGDGATGVSTVPTFIDPPFMIRPGRSGGSR
jgi:hypothetical protein